MSHLSRSAASVSFSSPVAESRMLVNTLAMFAYVACSMRLMPVNLPVMDVISLEYPVSEMKRDISGRDIISIFW